MTESHDRAIGLIEGKLDRPIEDMERATEKRALQYERIDRIERKQDHTERTAKEILHRLEKVEKPVSDFNRWRERAIGALMLVSLISAFVGGTLASYWGKIISIFKAF
ncbi:hypothetical protein N5853_11050 [Bartonella sp. HY329]|uniref:hypothetical protein n=1 Tax=unclassified Bartonella TaxID=2645622 RepID=UPI0021C9F463|nr:MULTISPECIES: hypothetical protein [unclassified Bartonella]UXM94630.1 hypothetical protein N5853_11050 [Bartonella sp. HY329]UXN08953.1 hypothetical protein N5852_11060 [Bartonella sp. HY328]